MRSALRSWGNSIFHLVRTVSFIDKWQWALTFRPQTGNFSASGTSAYSDFMFDLLRDKKLSELPLPCLPSATIWSHIPTIVLDWLNDFLYVFALLSYISLNFFNLSRALTQPCASAVCRACADVNWMSGIGRTTDLGSRLFFVSGDGRIGLAHRVCQPNEAPWSIRIVEFQKSWFWFPSFRNIRNS